MKKRMISLILVLALSLTACGQQQSETPPAQDETPAPQTQEQTTSPTVEPDAEPEPAELPPDYFRALDRDYVDASWAERDPDEQVTAREYAAMMTALLSQLAPDTLESFKSHVFGSDRPMSRGMGFLMSWYAAVELGINTYNFDFDMDKIKDQDDFWILDRTALNPVFTTWSQGPFAQENWDFDNELSAAVFWNVQHISPYSGEQTVAYDEDAGSMHNSAPFTVADALCAVSRLYDSADGRYAPSSDPAATVTTIGATVLAKAAETEVQSMDDLPRLTGFVLTDDFGSTELWLATPRRLRDIAGWGFTSVRIMATYETFFEDDGKTVKLDELRKLDGLIDAAIQNGLHLNLLLLTLPGRTYTWDWVTFESMGELDLFVNPERLEKAKLIWRTLAVRYKDVPGAYLSFQPLWEPSNPSLSTELPAPDYDIYDVRDTLEALVETIREADPDRFITYEASAEWDIESAIPSYEMMQKYENVRISFNFCEQPYVYALMADGGDETVHIDNQMHSAFLTDYPVTFYAARNHFGDGDPITLDGCLPAGTQIDIYVTHAEGGAFTATDQAGEVYREQLSRGDYERSAHLSMMYQYATSDKKISFTLNRDAEHLTLLCTDWVDICGMDIYLPEGYAQEKWYMYSPYDAALDGREDAAGLSLVSTTRVMICPSEYDGGERITIHDDLTYTTDTIWAEANKETIEAWGASIRDFLPAVIRFEWADFGFNTSSEAALRYYEDMLTMFDGYGLDWYSNDFYSMTGLLGEDYHYHGAELSDFEGYTNFDLPLLQLLQKHQ